MSNLKRYPQYKDSGVPWLGEIPSHWKILKMKFAMSNISQKENASETDLRYFGLENIEPHTGKLVDDVELVSEGVGNIFRSGDVLFGKLRPYLAKVYLSRNNGLVSTEAFVLRAFDFIYPKFLFYYCLSPDFIDQVNGTTFGSKMPRASWDNVSNFLICYPKLDEQKSIVKFLDKKLNHIDTLISKQEQLLDKLAEQRSAVITNAVTKGLDPNVPIKDSEIEWLGEIPEHWEVKKLSYIIENIGTGSTPPTNEPDYYDESDPIDWFNPSDFKGSSILFDSKKKLNRKSIIDKVVKPIPAGSVLLIGIGATLGKVGIVEYECTTNQQINYITLNDTCDSKFIMYSLKDQLGIMKLYSSASTLGILNQEKTKSLILSVPPFEEQINIKNYLDDETAKIDQLVSATENIITKLKEYRSALITQVVTGKFDVRDMAEETKGVA